MKIFKMQMHYFLMIPLCEFFFFDFPNQFLVS